MSQHNILVATECDQMKRFFVRTEQFYVATELARLGRFSILIEDFYVAIESSSTHDRAGCVRLARARQCGVVLCRDRGGQEHTIDQARRAQ